MSEAANTTPPPYTESGLADHLLRHWGDGLRYCESLDRWLMWNDGRWEMSSASMLQRALKLTLRSLRKAVLDQQKVPRLPLLVRAEKRNVREAILALAKFEAVQIDAVD